MSSAEAAKFNFSSIFLDETINDIEPRLDELIMKSMKAIDKGIVVDAGPGSRLI